MELDLDEFFSYQKFFGAMCPAPAAIIAYLIPLLFAYIKYQKHKAYHKQCQPTLS